MLFQKSKELGKISVPFIATVFGYNSNANSINDVSDANDLGDLTSLITTPSTEHDVRIAVPFQIRKLTALHFEFKANPDVNTQLRLATGRQNIQFSASFIEYENQEVNRQTAILGGPWNLVAGQDNELNIDILPVVQEFLNYEDDPYFFLTLFFSVDVVNWNSFTKFWVKASGDLPEQFL